MGLETASFNVSELEMEIAVEAPVERVWEALTERIHEWWPRDFMEGKDAKRMVLEPVAGGRMYEDWGDGQGLVWYTVVSVLRNERILLSGELFPGYGGPARLQTSWGLEAKGRGTLLKFSDTAYGRVPEETARANQEGWKMLLGKLKAFAEG